MKRTILLLAALATLVRAHACDACGCAAGAQYLGLLPRAATSFIGLQYQYNGFTSHHPSLFLNHPGEQGAEQYHTLQLWGRYALSRRVQLFAFVPYRYNVQQTTTTYSRSGLGDVSVLANVVMLNDSESRWQQQLFGGGGVKAPTGRYVGITELDKAGLPNMQPGTGAWDVVLNVNHTLRRHDYGLNTDAAYTITTPNGDGYKYGNRLGIGAVAFYGLGKKQLSIVPQAGFRYEYTLHDYDNYNRKWLNEQTGGHIAYAALGVQAWYRRLGFKAGYLVPVTQHYSAGYVTARQRLDAGLFFLL